MIKSLNSREKIISIVIFSLTCLLIGFLIPADVAGQDYGVIVGLQHDGHRIGTAVGMIKTLSPKLSLFVEGVIRDPEYEANARFAISLPLYKQFKMTMLLGPGVQNVPTEIHDRILTSYVIYSTGVAFSHPLTDKSNAWIAMDWTPDTKYENQIKFGIGVIAWL